MKYSENNKPLICMMTQSTCYKGTSKMTPKGILWHSTGANNPTLKRYIQPDDDALNKNELIKLLGKNDFGNDWNHANIQAGLNCWIGKLDDGTVTTVQTMPWDYRPWGCGSGPKGSCNNGWIQFEICEDKLTDKTYFDKVYKEACEITAYLCKKYNIDPKGTITVNGVKVPTILCHHDAYKLGFGSGHQDIDHWFPKYGKSMETARNDVAKLLSSNTPIIPETESETPSNTSAPTKELYRIRKNWQDSKSQIGAFAVFDNAKNSCDKAGTEYSVYNSKGQKVYPEEKNSETIVPPSKTPYLAKINTQVLNVRAGAGTSYKINTQVRRNEIYTIVEEKGNWGKLKSGAGWICLDYIKEV